jgi:uncharacterized membrane protein YfcA
LLTAKQGLFLALGAFAIFYLVRLWRGAPAEAGTPPEASDGRLPTPLHLAVGFVTDFFDTLGVGSFAPTTSIFKFARMVPDRLIPGTLNVGHTLPTVVQALLFIAIVAVGSTTLLSLIGAAIAGAWLGAGFVSGWSRQAIQRGMGVALLAAATLLVLSLFNIGPPGGTALSLSGPWLAVGIVGNFMLGALMPLGIGLYGPCLIMISLLGMDPLAAFPIMMGSCAFLMPISSARFIEKGCYARRPALGLAIGGIPGVLIAWYFVKSLPLLYVRWLVVVVVVYTAGVLLRSSLRRTSPEASSPSPRA